MKRDPNLKDDSDSSHAERKPRSKKCRTRRRRRVSRQEDDCEQRSCFVALDCEMVGVGSDGRQSALARVSIVDWDGGVLLDTFVKVSQPITDYRTDLSGVRPNDLVSEYALDFEECREWVQLLLKDKIVVGHGLKNDFNVLNLSHPWQLQRDTTKFEPFLKADPYHPLSLIPNKLKVLAHDILGIDIQPQGAMHDSVEDAQASMLLYKKVQYEWEKTMAYKVQKTENILNRVMVA